MVDGLVVEPMAESLLLWRCLHHGPLSRDTIDQWPAGGEVPWERCRTRNLPLLEKLTQVYGACAVVARDGNWSLEGIGRRSRLRRKTLEPA